MSYTDADKNSGNTFENGGNVEFANSGLLNINKMTPGDRVDIKVTVTNNSDIGVRYRTNFKDATTDAMKKNGVSLFDGLVFSVNGKRVLASKTTKWSDEIAPNGSADVLEEIDIVVAFPDGGMSGEDNKYQGLECALAIKVEAVQSNANIAMHTPPEDAPTTSGGKVPRDEQEQFQQSTRYTFYGGVDYGNHGYHADNVAVYDFSATANTSLEDVLADYKNIPFSSSYNTSYYDTLNNWVGEGRFKTVSLKGGVLVGENEVVKFGPRYRFATPQADGNNQYVAGNYNAYLCEFVISCDKFVPAGTAGVYGELLGMEYGFISPEHIDVDDEIYVIELLLKMGGLGVDGVAVPFELLDAYLSGVFYCAPVIVGNENIGTTMTVELRMYEPIMTFFDAGYASADEAFAVLNNPSSDEELMKAISCFTRSENYYILNSVQYTYGTSVYD
jgi:hypothetical protein